MDYTNKSIEKAACILDLFAADTPRLSATEIARRLGTKASIIYPILRTLQTSAYLMRDEDKKYSLGFKFLERANLVLQRLDLHTVAQKYLKKLANTCSVNAHLGILYGYKVLYLHREVGSSNVFIREIVGLSEPAYCTALGKTLLASLPEDEQESYLTRESLVPFTPHTITSPDALRVELGRIRRDGFAISNEEAHEGVVGVAAPVTDFRGRVRAAISISIPRSRWHNEEAELIGTVKETASLLSRDLGASKKDEAFRA
ncbi:MAG: IclR family transcriptional regulator [Deltaproteobacteria bacterium]|nr:IclR family transcriptional regulator [Deltaproteobacteria bacterium]